MPVQGDLQEIRSLADSFERESLERVLQWAWDRFGAQAAIGTSFQGAGLVIIHQALKAGFRFPVFTLDTGLLFPETLELKGRLESFFGIEIESLHPEQTPDDQAGQYGPELWKSKPDTCCMLRKVLPLQKKLAEIAVWITGVRRQQSGTRAGAKILELYRFDVLRNHHILKLNPLAGWSREEVWAYLKKYEIPYNPLHDRGYRSIGCMPCTRPVGEGESERAGRWTGFDKAECGIHTFLGENI